jgi:uncharacterized cysteine cluster protein YcgN (CxxCxxCC family)
MSPLRPRFWETVPLKKMTPAEWEALCDGCGKCCLNKLEFEDTGEVAYTNIACRLFDDATCRCADYANRKVHVPECVVLTPKTLARKSPIGCPRPAPTSCCAGSPLPAWHPLLTGDAESTHAKRAIDARPHGVGGWCRR